VSEEMSFANSSVDIANSYYRIAGLRPARRLNLDSQENFSGARINFLCIFILLMVPWQWHGCPVMQMYAVKVLVGIQIGVDVTLTLNNDC